MTDATIEAATTAGPLPRRPRASRRFVLTLLAIALLGFGIRTVALTTAAQCRQPNRTDLALALIGKTPPNSGCVVLTDAPVYLEQAVQNAQGYWFQSAPLDDQGHRQPSGLHPPLYATFLSIFTLAGVRDFDTLRAISSLLGIATIVLSGLFGRRLLGDRVGLIAAFLVAIHPMVWINDVVLMSESLFALFVPLVGFAALNYWDRRDIRSASIFGLVIGLAALTRSEAILFVAVAGAPMALGQQRLRSTEAWKQFAALAATALLVVSPWIGWNLVRFEKPALFTTTAGFSMAFANCPTVYENGPMLGTRSTDCLAIASARIRPHLGDDQSSIDAQLVEGALRSAKADPGGAGLAAGARVGRMWGVYRPFQTIRLDEPLERRGIGRSEMAVVFGWEVMAAGAYGAVLLRRRRLPLSPLLGWVFTSTIVAVLDLGLHRFRATSDVALCILAAVAVDQLWGGKGASAARAATTAPPPPAEEPTMATTSARRHLPLRPFGALAITGVLLLGCGGGSDDADSTTTVASTAARSTSVVPDPAAKTFCSELQGVFDQGSVIAALKIDTDADVPAAKAQLLLLLDAMNDALVKAPDAIGPQADRFAAYVKKLRPAVADVRTKADLMAQLPRVAQALAGQTDVTATDSTEVIAYVTANCPDLEPPT